MALPEMTSDTPGQLRKSIAVIDGTAAHRKQAVAALQATYRVLEFGNTTHALCDLARTPAHLIIVDEAAEPHGCQEFIRLVKALPQFLETPILLLYPTLRADSAATAARVGADAFITKPYRRSELYRAVSSLINVFVERDWEKLPEGQRTILKKSLDVFNSIADALESDQEIPYSSLASACTPLIDAVKRNDFKGVLDGVRKHDNYTYAHCLAVATYMTLLGHTIGLRDKDLHLIAGAGLMHDVGKLTIPHDILNKCGPLTPEEWVIMKGHAAASARCLERHQTIPKLIVDVAEQHHERIDGSGYPRGLTGAELHEVTRMATIVDVFSALTDRRPYKPAMEAPDALTIMTESMPGHFDKTLLTIFIKSLIQTETIVETEMSRQALVKLRERR